MNYIDESGLYSLIFSSNLQSAKQFKKWVTTEVLPNIRKHGYYLDTKFKETLNLLSQKSKELQKTIKEKIEVVDNDIFTTSLNE